MCLRHNKLMWSTLAHSHSLWALNATKDCGFMRRLFAGDVQIFHRMFPFVEFFQDNNKTCLSSLQTHTTESFPKASHASLQSVCASPQPPRIHTRKKNKKNMDMHNISHEQIIRPASTISNNPCHKWLSIGLVRGRPNH